MTDTQAIADAAARLNRFREAALQQRVDEEGCGAVVLALRLEGIRHPMLREGARD